MSVLDGFNFAIGRFLGELLMIGILIIGITVIAFAWAIFDIKREERKLKRRQ